MQMLITLIIKLLKLLISLAAMLSVEIRQKQNANT